ncbi:MAG: phage portal protein, partial [Planctomycetaceae bacterium]|nr:phage portal protein [Planctomycetaceae bacterium]
RNPDGTPYALWPIHPSRIPLHNIRRNDRLGEIRVGTPGRLVFYVKSGDGEVVPVPEENMLVVPGVLSANGITGRGLIDIGAEAIGVARAVEAHAGAFFANGAVPGLFVNYEAMLKPERADALRLSFEKRYKGVDNHYSTLLVDGAKATAQVLGIDPEKTQLLQARQFSIAEVSRIWRVPMHMLSDLSRATWTNVESQGIEFVVHSLRPWIIRWERALNRQLLTDEQRERFYFKFNLNALLRGDSQARASFYQTMQQMGVFSINEIRDLEDLDPIENGDVRLIPSNNMTPLNDVVSGTGDAPPPKTQPRPVDDPQGDNELHETGTEGANNYRMLAAISAEPSEDATTFVAPSDTIFSVGIEVAHKIGRIVDYETRRLEEASRKPREFSRWMANFYGDGFRKHLMSKAVDISVVLGRVGVAMTPDSFCDLYVSESASDVDAAFDVSHSAFPDAIRAITGSWSGRAAEMATRLLGDSNAKPH